MCSQFRIVLDFRSLQIQNMKRVVLVVCSGGGKGNPTLIDAPTGFADFSRKLLQGDRLAAFNVVHANFAAEMCSRNDATTVTIELQKIGPRTERSYFPK